MHHGTANTQKETVLLTKIGRLPVLPRKKQRGRQFREPNAHVLLWLHSVTLLGKCYHMQCETLEDGTRVFPGDSPSLIEACTSSALRVVRLLVFPGRQPQPHHLQPAEVQQPP